MRSGSGSIQVAELGHLIKDMKFQPLEEVYFFSMPIKESEITDFFLGHPSRRGLKIMLLQKQTHPGQKMFKAFVSIGDYNGQVGLGIKRSKEVTSAICQVITLVKLSVVPVW
ncbi:hypothetical protein HJG60_016636 [Phyllostomus discolor]|uniref:S5 DRBM domain-containing protein n=1 Tax=Phyllostomus discolor TaxID=89673 RepID=A0A834AQP6_9CHIR|nr:hypothetical protein HJG60_016636 [Phyllostomus discolor]